MRDHQEATEEEPATAHALAQAQGHNQLGVLFLKSRKFLQAEKHFESALRLVETTPTTAPTAAPIRAKVVFNLANTQLALGKQQEAIASFQLALDNKNNFVEAMVNLSAQLMIMGHLSEAERLCRQAITCSLTQKLCCPQAHYNLNGILRRTNRQQEAIEWSWQQIQRDIDAMAVASRTIGRTTTASDHDDFSLLSSLLSGGVKTVPPPEDEQEQQQRRHLEREQAAAQEEDKMPCRVVSVVCVKWGTKYNADYVNRLYSSVQRACRQIQIEFFCLVDEDSDGLHGDIRVCRLETGWTGWWNKAQLFSGVFSKLLSDRCVYIDLDTVITGQLDQLLTCQARFALLKTDFMANEQRTNGFNSSVIVWQNGIPEFRGIFDFLKAHFEVVHKYIYKFDHWLEMWFARLNSSDHCACPCEFLDELLPNQFVEYKTIEQNGQRLPQDARLVCFPLQPKPHEAQRVAWIDTHWR